MIAAAGLGAGAAAMWVISRYGLHANKDGASALALPGPVAFIDFQSGIGAILAAVVSWLRPRAATWKSRWLEGAA
jgi:hypothetical protein